MVFTQKKPRWLNNTNIINSNREKDKPCHELGYCPYGQLVEEYPIREQRDSKISCVAFGHDCPMFYLAEDMTE